MPYRIRHFARRLVKCHTCLSSYFSSLMKQTASFTNSSLTKLSSSIIQKCSAFNLVFEYFDEDRDGKISPAELRSCMRTLGEEISVEDVEVVVESSDSDGDGLLGFKDFVRLMEVEGEDQEKGKELREAFGMYEMEGSRSITPKSLKRMLSRLGESKSVEECKGMIQHFDLNGDGVLSFQEFRIMML